MAKKSGKRAAPKRTAAKIKPRKGPAKKPPVAPKAEPAEVKPRRLKHTVKLPSSWRIARSAALTVWGHKGLFIGITLVYGLLSVILAQSLAGGTDVATLKDTLGQVFGGHFGALAGGFSIFVLLVSSAGNGSSATAGAYQLFLAITTSLAIIWTLRQLIAGASGFRVRDTYYRSMYPLVPFILVLLIVGLQVVPLLIGSSIYGTVMSNGIAVHLVEKLVWALLYALLALWSLYMVSSSLFALYIVTLPDMTPMKALRSARELVRKRRWTVLRKIVCLPIILLAIAAIIMVPIIVWLTPLAQWVFFLLTMFSLVAIHAYMYTLYRELLNE